MKRDSPQQSQVKKEKREGGRRHPLHQDIQFSSAELSMQTKPLLLFKAIGNVRIEQIFFSSR